MAARFAHGGMALRSRARRSARWWFFLGRFALSQALTISRTRSLFRSDHALTAFRATSGCLRRYSRPSASLHSTHELPTRRGAIWPRLHGSPVKYVLLPAALASRTSLSFLLLGVSARGSP